MECKDIKMNLLRIVEGTLPEEESRAVSNHLHSCSDCSAILSEFMQTMELIREDNRREPDPFAGTRILQRLESDLFRGYPGKQSSPYRFLQPVFLAIGMLAAVMIGFSIGKKSIRAVEDFSALQEIESVRSDLFISDLTGDDRILFLNP